MTVSSTVQRHSSPALLSVTSSTRDATTAVTTTATRAPSGESASSRVLPPVNVTDMLSTDQLRQRTEAIYQRAIHSVAVADSVTANVSVHEGAESAHEGVELAREGAESACERAESVPVPKEAVRPFADTVTATAMDVTDSDCDTVGVEKVSADVSASVGSDILLGGGAAN